MLRNIIGTSMKIYTKILYWENRNRLRKLNSFRALVIDYFDNSRAEWMVQERIEQPPAQLARVQINRLVDGIHDILYCAGISPVIRYTPPPAVGGHIQKIDILHNIFNLTGYSISSSNLLDYLDRAIGIYEGDKGPAILRTINPFFYLGIVLDWIVRFPFNLIGRAGFNREKIEESIAGRVTKVVLYVSTVSASTLTVLQLLDHLEPVKTFIKSIVG